MKDLCSWNFIGYDAIDIAIVIAALLLFVGFVFVVNWLVRLVAKIRNRRIVDFDIIDRRGFRHKGFFSDPSVFHSSTGKVFVKVGPADNDWERVE